MEPDEQNNPNSNNSEEPPENTEQNQNHLPTNQSTENENNNPPANNPSTENPSTNLREIYEGIIREQNAELERLRNAQVNPPKPEPSKEEINKQYWEDPVSVIEERIKKTVAPLLDMQEQFRKEREINRYLNVYKNDPRFSKIFSLIEPTVTKMLESSPQLNDGIVQTAMLSAAGALAVGAIPGAALPTDNNNNRPQDNNNPPDKNKMTTPAHLRPSAPNAPVGNDNKPKLRELTESEERLRREYKMTKEEFIKYMELPADQVATYTPSK